LVAAQALSEQSAPRQPDSHLHLPPKQTPWEEQPPQSSVDEFEVGAAVVKESSVSMASCGDRDGNVSQL
jgi:hypothetical protein